MEVFVVDHHAVVVAVVVPHHHHFAAAITPSTSVPSCWQTVSQEFVASVLAWHLFAAGPVQIPTEGR